MRHRRRCKKLPRPHDVRERGGPLEKRAEGSCGGPSGTYRVKTEERGFSNTPSATMHVGPNPTLGKIQQTDEMFHGKATLTPSF
jgi:hypothetical protein